MDLKTIIEEASDNWGRETVAAILKRIDSIPIKWNGTLRRSISYEQDGTDITFNMTDYGKFIDEGVSGTKIKRDTPYSFRGNYKGTAYFVKDWALSKGKNPWAIARVIQKEGIKARPFFNSVIESRVPDLEPLIAQAVEDYITSKLSGE
jgi:hypothetical protein